MVTVPVVRGGDGKLYPVPRRRSTEDNQRAADLIHALRHRGASFPQITRRLPDYGLQVSYGSVVNLWQTTECDRCLSALAKAPRPAPVSAAPTVSPRPRARAEVFPWR